tara:strand:- start:256 stop:891 length:636 start_codon:yes stop_codon:yes gene_type:complete
MLPGYHASMAMMIVGIGMLSIGLVLIIIRHSVDILQKNNWSGRYSGFLVLLGLTLISFSTLKSRTQNQDLVTLANAIEAGDGMQTLKCVQKNMSLLEADFSKIGNGAPLIHRAIDSGKLAILTLAVSSNNPPLHVLDQQGRTPLIHALENRELSMTNVLLNRGASPSCKSPRGIDACTLAIEQGPEFAEIFARLAPEIYAQHSQLVVKNTK